MYQELNPTADGGTCIRQTPLNPEEIFGMTQAGRGKWTSTKCGPFFQCRFFIWMFLCVSTTVWRLPFVFLTHFIYAQTRTKTNEQRNVVQLTKTCQNTHTCFPCPGYFGVCIRITSYDIVCLVSSFGYSVLCVSVFSRNSWTRKSRSLTWSEK